MLAISSPGSSPLSKWRGGSRNRWTTLSKFFKNRGVICHVTYDVMIFFRMLFPAISSRVLFFSQSLAVVQTKRRHFIIFHATNYNIPGFLENFSSLLQGYARHFERGKRPGTRFRVICALACSALLTHCCSSLQTFCSHLPVNMVLIFAPYPSSRLVSMWFSTDLIA